MLVSIGIPTRDRAKLLSRALDSALGQGPNVEVIVSDNASSDETPQHGLARASADSRVVFSRSEVALPPFANFRRTLSLAKGDLFMWLGDDDWLEPGYINGSLAALRADPSILGVVGSTRYYHDAQFVGLGATVRCLSASPSERLLAYLRQVEDNAIFYGLYPRQQLLQTTLKDGFGSDWLFTASLAFRGRLQTLDTVNLNRSTQGLSSSNALSRSRAQRLWLGLAFAVFVSVAVGDRNLASLNAFRRLSLAKRAYGTVCARKGTSMMLAIRGALRVRTRIRDMVRRAP